MTDVEADPSVKVVVFQSANPDFSSPISTYPRQLNGQRCWAFGATLCCASRPTAASPHGRPATGRGLPGIGLFGVIGGSLALDGYLTGQALGQSNVSVTDRRQTV
jgi:hypothetical protein